MISAEHFKHFLNLTQEEVFDRIRYPEEYPYSTFTSDHFQDWMKNIMEDEYDRGYHDSTQDSYD